MSDPAEPRNIDKATQMVHRLTDLVHDRSLKDPDAFWAEAAETIDWYSRWDRVCDRSRAPLDRWFSGATVNTCYNALDRHVARGRAAQPALIYDSPVTGTIQTFTYRELRDSVATFAGALARLGRLERRPHPYLHADDSRGCGRDAGLGAARRDPLRGVWRLCVAASWPHASTMRSRKSSSPHHAASSQDGSSRTSRCSTLRSTSPGTSRRRCIVFQRPMAAATSDRRTRSSSGTTPSQAQRRHDCVPVSATDPLYILYTSGTTGKPKGIVRDNGGHPVALAWSMKHIYGAESRRRVLGGLGHRLGRRSLVHRLWSAARRMHDDPVRGQAGRHARCRRVLAGHLAAQGDVLFTAPTAFRAIKREDPNGS